MLNTFFVEIAYTYRGDLFTFRTAVMETSADEAKARAARSFTRSHMDDAEITEVRFY